MMRPEDLEGWDEPEPLVAEQTTAVDLEGDLLTTMEESYLEDAAPDEETDADAAGRIATAELDNALVEFVDLANARDLEGLADILAPDAESDFLTSSTREALVDGMGQLFLQYPTMVITRGDLGSDPIAVAWLPDPDIEHFEPIGYFVLEVSEEEEPDGALIERLEYIEGLPESDDLVVEAPDDTDHPEWDDWVVED